jgi:spore germination cell wall hydrolase CwlJ-like protein
MIGAAMRLGFFTAILTALFPAWPQKVRAALPKTTSAAANTQSANVNQEDWDTLARTLWGEGRSEGYTGMQAIANVIMNRYKQRPRFGSTVAGVCTKPYQFSAWNAGDPNYYKMMAVTENDPLFKQAKEIALKALQGRLPDITGGADHYLNVPLTRQINNGALPSWVNLANKTATVGKHTFLTA